jgi:hypothetical protein
MARWCKQENTMLRRDFIKAAGAGALLAPLAASEPSVMAANSSRTLPESMSTTNGSQAIVGKAKDGVPVSMLPAQRRPGAVELRFRQVHLDFHTSEQIPGVGDQFDPEEFASTLEKARVNSVTVFARCHHGWIYYDTKAFPERRHPQLKRNLLKEQIEALHKRNIRAPIYLTVQWDHYTANQHPEWMVIDERGSTGHSLYEAGFYRQLCLNSPYVDFLRAHVKEILDLLPTDGLWFDILLPVNCSCRYCRVLMDKEGLEPSDADARRRFGDRTVLKFKQEMTDYVRQFNRDCFIFYNSGHIGPKLRSSFDSYTHLELESLPSGGWGYLHLPISMRYARNQGLDCMGMTGKFQTSWGDFHSYKNPAALEFECFHMLALGGKCSVGDQLHPSGKIDPATYELIGSVYSEVEKKEPWCAGARPLTEVGVLTPEEFSQGDERVLPPARGFTRLLEEGRHQFDVLDSTSDFSRYRLIILPDQIPVDALLAAKIDEFVSEGGSLVCSYQSGLGPDHKQFQLKCLGIRLKGEAPYSPDFLLPRGKIGEGLPPTEHVMYLKGMEVEALPGSHILCDVVVPYFNRTYKHFSSHRQTPSSGKVGYPGIVQNGRIIYFAHPIFTQYDDNAPLWCKKLFLNALSLLLPEPLVRVLGPSTILATLNEQARENRWVLHLLHYVPERRSQTIDIIGDVIPLFDLKVSVKVPRRVRSVQVVPQGKNLDQSQEGDRVEFVVPRLNGHEMIALNFT